MQIVGFLMRWIISCDLLSKSILTPSYLFKPFNFGLKSNFYISFIDICHFPFQPINLISGSSYEQVQNKDSKFNGDKMSTGMVRKGVQAHADGK